MPRVRPDPRAYVRIRAVTGSSPVAAAGWSARVQGEPTTVVLVRHGITEFTTRKLFSGSGGADLPLIAEGVEQARRAGDWIAAGTGADAIVASPLLRTRQTADEIAAALDVPVQIDDGFAEVAFGDWDGHSFGDIARQWPEEMDAWLASTSVAPPGGESFDAAAARVDAARQRLLGEHAGRTVVVVSHVSPIKLMVGAALGADITSIYRMELAPASISTITWWPDGAPSLRNFSVVP